MRKLLLTAIGAVLLFGVWGVAHGRGVRVLAPVYESRWDSPRVPKTGTARAPEAVPAAPQAAAAPAAPKDKAAYFTHSDIESTWKDLEARQVINKRVLDGGAYSINIRIVKEGDAPLVHSSSADVWVTMEGSATAVTGGQLVDGKKRPNVDDEAGTAIRGGVEQALKPGDVLFVPAGVPHGFKDIKGFRAYLIRFDTK